MPAPRVLISYSHDSDAHRAWVFNLAGQLRERGIDAWLDRYDRVPPEGWSLWMEKQFKQAKFVLAVCTETYRERFDHEAPEGEGDGVLCEAQLIRNYLRSHGRENTKILPVLPENQSKDDIPDILGDYSCFRLLPQLDELCAHLLGNGITAPPLGGANVRSAGALGNPEGEVLCSSECPFAPFEPATGPAFVGRDGLMREVWDAIEHGNSLSLVGDHRIGKSSILVELGARLRAAGYAVAQSDGTGGEGACPRAFVAHVTGSDVADDIELVADRLATWGRREQERTKRKPVVLVDEFDGMILRFPPRFLERCRPMMDQIVFVFATRQEIDRIYRTLPVTSPFDNRMPIHRVGLLEDADAWVRRGSPVLTADDVQEMRRLCGAHPFFLSLCGGFLWDARTSGGNVRNALDHFLDNAARHLRELWRHLSEREQRLVIAAAGGTARTSRPLVRRGVLAENGLPFGAVLVEWLEEEGLL